MWTYWNDLDDLALIPRKKPQLIYKQIVNSSWFNTFPLIKDELIFIPNGPENGVQSLNAQPTEIVHPTLNAFNFLQHQKQFNINVARRPSERPWGEFYGIYPAFNQKGEIFLPIRWVQIDPYLEIQQLSSDGKLLHRDLIGYDGDNPNKAGLYLAEWDSGEKAIFSPTVLASDEHYLISWIYRKRRGDNKVFSNRFRNTNLAN